jgi:UBX domain-containing protein 1
VGDGDLRAYDAPENAAFLADMNRGAIPRELEAQARAAGKGRMGVDVEDHRGDNYTPPAYRAFGGAGATIARAAPPSGAVVRGGAGAAGPAAVDAAAPTTTIQVRLLDGRREKVVLNLTHTVADLQAAVARLAATGSAAGKPFLLVGGYPPKPLDNPGLTIEAAGLKSAAVTQQSA